jgi:hypothetical protein
MSIPFFTFVLLIHYFKLSDMARPTTKTDLLIAANGQFDKLKNHSGTEIKTCADSSR